MLNTSHTVGVIESFSTSSRYHHWLKPDVFLAEARLYDCKLFLD